MASVSLCMIVRNEQLTLGRCLTSVAGLVDEIIVVDTGSSDGTRQIAQGFGAHVYDYAWADDFAAARNFSFSKASRDFILWLDADDVLLEKDRDSFRTLRAELDPRVDVVMMRYDAGFDCQGNVTLSYPRERLLKRSRGFQWFEPVHEYIQPAGLIISADITVTHLRGKPALSGRNLAIYETMLKAGRPLSSRSLFYYGTELCYHGLYEKAAEALNRFLEAHDGWMEDRVRACCCLADCYQALNRPEQALEALLKSLGFGAPRPEVCCRLGYHFKATGDYRSAAFWFELAVHVKPPKDSWAFVYHDLCGYIPALELCVCHYQLGNIREARHWNAEAAHFKPDSPAVAHNYAFFGRLEAAADTPESPHPPQ